MKTFLLILGIIFIPFFTSLLLHFLYYYYVKNMRFIEGEYRYIGHGSKLKRLYVDFPKRLIIDRFKRNPDHFPEFGIHIIAGKQGTGKSITLTYLLLRYQKMYPKLIVKTNYYYEFEKAHIRTLERHSKRY